MIVLCYLVIALLSFTRISIWLQVALALVPSVLMSAQMHNLVPIRVAVFALAGALVPYVPLVALASFVIAGGFRTAFRRLRFIYFLFVLLAVRRPRLQLDPDIVVSRVTAAVASRDLGSPWCAPG